MGTDPIQTCKCGYRHSTSVMIGPTGKHEVVHECPPGDSNIMPCCGRTPFEIPGYHRMAIEQTLVSCRG